MPSEWLQSIQEKVSSSACGNEERLHEPWKIRGFQQKCYVNQSLSSSVLLDLIAKYEGNFWMISEPSRNLHGHAGLSSLWAIDSGTVESYLPCRCSHTPSVLKKRRKLHVYPQGCLSTSIHSFKQQQSPLPFWNSPRDCHGSRGPRSNKEPFHDLSGQPSLILNVRSYVLSEAGLAMAPGQSSV